MDIFPSNINAPYTPQQITPTITGVDSTIIFEHLSSLLPSINNNVKHFFGNNTTNDDTVTGIKNNRKIPVRRHSSAEFILALSSSAAEVPIIEVTPPSPAGRSEKRTFEVEINKMFTNTLNLCKRNIRRFSAPYCSVNHLDLSSLGKNAGTFDERGRPRTNSMPCISKENLLQVPKKNGGRSGGSNKKKKKRRSSLPDFVSLQRQQKIRTNGSLSSVEKINYFPSDVEGGPPKAVHEIYISGLRDNSDNFDPNENGRNGSKDEENVSKEDLEEKGQTISSSNEPGCKPDFYENEKIGFKVRESSHNPIAEKIGNENYPSEPRKIPVLKQQDAIDDHDNSVRCQIGIKTKYEQPITRQSVEYIPSPISERNDLTARQIGIKPGNEQLITRQYVESILAPSNSKKDCYVTYHDEVHETFNKIKKEYKRKIKDYDIEKTDKMMRINNKKNDELIFKQDSLPRLSSQPSDTSTLCELNEREYVCDSWSRLANQPSHIVTHHELDDRDVSDSSLAEKLIINSLEKAKRENHDFDDVVYLSSSNKKRVLLSDDVLVEHCCDKNDDNNNKVVKLDTPLSQRRSQLQTQEKHKGCCRVTEKGEKEDEISQKQISDETQHFHYQQKQSQHSKRYYQSQKLRSQETHDKHKDKEVTVREIEANDVSYQKQHYHQRHHHHQHKVSEKGQKDTSFKENVIPKILNVSEDEVEINVICKTIRYPISSIDDIDECGSGSVCCCNIDSQNKNKEAVSTALSELCFHNDIIQDKHHLFKSQQQRQYIYSGFDGRSKRVLSPSDDLVKEKHIFHQQQHNNNIIKATEEDFSHQDQTLNRTGCCYLESSSNSNSTFEEIPNSKKQSVDHIVPLKASLTKSDYACNNTRSKTQKSAELSTSTNVTKEAVTKPHLLAEHKNCEIAHHHQIFNNNNQTCNRVCHPELKEEIADKHIIAVPLKSTCFNNSRVVVTGNQIEARQLQNSFEGPSLLSSTTSYNKTKLSLNDLHSTEQSFNDRNNKYSLLPLNDEPFQRKQQNCLITDTRDLKTFKETDQHHTSQELLTTTEKSRSKKLINSSLTNASFVSIAATTVQEQELTDNGKKVANCNQQQFPKDSNNNKVNYHTDAIRVINSSSEQDSIVETILKSTTTIKEVKSTIIMAMNNEIDEGNNNDSFHNHHSNSCVKRNATTLEKRNSDILIKSENEDSVLNIEQEEANFGINGINGTATELSDTHNTKTQDSEENSIKKPNSNSTEDINDSTTSADMSPTRHQLSSVISDVLSGKNPGVGVDLTSNLFFLPNTNKDANKDSMFGRGKVVYNAKSEDCNLVVTADPKEKQPDVVVDNTDSLSSTSASSESCSDSDNDSTLNNTGNNSLTVSKTALTKASSLTGLETYQKKGESKHHHLTNETRTVSLHEDSIHDKKLLDALSNIDPNATASKPEAINNKPTSKSMEELDVGTKLHHQHQHRPAATTTALATRVSALNRINKEFANAMLRKAVSLVEIQNERLKENVAKWEQRFMSTEILSAPEEDWFPRVSMEDCSTCASCRSRSSSYHNLLYDFDTASQFPIYQPTVIDYEEDVEAIYNGIVSQSSENLSSAHTKDHATVADHEQSATTTVDNDTTLSSDSDVTTSPDDVPDMDKTIVETTSSNIDDIENTLQQSTEPTPSDNVAATVVVAADEGEDNKTKQMLKLKKDKFMKQSQLAFGSLKDRFRKVKSKV